MSATSLMAVAASDKSFGLNTRRRSKRKYLQLHLQSSSWGLIQT